MVFSGAVEFILMAYLREVFTIYKLEQAVRSYV